VIGRVRAALLARISESGDRIRSQVEDLRSLELIYEKALHPELAYMFKHALTHDVAYESVVSRAPPAPARHHRLRHRGAVRDRLAEHVETLAHFGRAEDWPSALAYTRAVGRQSRQAHANRAVVAHCRGAGDRGARRRG
jgi:hypothetical protein